MEMRAEVAWPRPADLTDEQAEALGRDLPGFPVVVDGGFYLYARFDVDGDGIGQAAAASVTIAGAAYAAAFGATVDPVQVAVYPADPGLIPGPMDLVGLADVGQMLGVSRQRAGQLADRLPVPVGHPSGVPAWVRSAVERVTAGWERRTGRPSKQATS